MLEIKGITKIYDTGGFKQKALDKVSINFRKCEFAAILGPSGSGKTTLLNIIGGLDHYTSGDLLVNGISTKQFKDKDWDSYRNHRIGFVFQSYNLIGHQTILQNVKLALTLSGISKREATRRATKALKEVGLEKHINKKPNQLSGGQMQRVAIARALVNDPEILLADEPTGALDSETSVQIMELLKEISKTKLVIMVTHNPDLAKQYSTRIIDVKDGKIIGDNHPYDNTDAPTEDKSTTAGKRRKTKMSFFTALGLSFKNLLTKKGRTILVAFAGSIGIIGIALILAVSTGFQNYVDSIQEDTLTSYPLSINQESTDFTSVLLAMTSGTGGNNNNGEVTENQLITSMLGNISTNDLANFKKYLNTNFAEIEPDISTIKYSYNIDPPIYAIDATSKIAKLNPSKLFSSLSGGSSLLSSYSSLTSIYSQMIDNQDTVREQYDILAGHLPENYDEMLLVLSEPNSIPDLLVYSLGLRDTDELTEMVTKIMSGESVKIENQPLTLSYEDLMSIKLKLIEPADLYKYNEKYDVYEDMSEDEDYLSALYNNAEDLKIVGIVSPKAGSTTSALSPGVAYTSDLIRHIVNYSSTTSAVKKQLENPEIDVFSGNRFDAKKNNFDFSFSDLVSVDEDKLAGAFGIRIDQSAITAKTTEYMQQIASEVTTDITPAKTDFINTFKSLAEGVKDTLKEPTIDPETGEYNPGFTLDEIDGIVTNYLNNVDINDLLKVPYKGLLESVLSAHLAMLTNTQIDAYSTIVEQIAVSPEFDTTATTIASKVTEGLMQQQILTKVGELTTYLSNSFANAFFVDQDALISSFKLNFSEEELARVVQAMFTKTESTITSNLSALGYQDLDDPTRISFYFNSFDGKERFLNFLDRYNELMENSNQDSKVIQYSDTTGVLMSSVKTIVDAVSYVLIAFVSISLVVSSIMIGIITYISVYERTKEIGILRAIGASKRNISNIFNAETFIIGLLSGLFGIGLSYLFIPIINAILHHFTGDIPLSASLAIESAGVLILVSIILTLIGGLIPAKSASKKDPVEALRSE